MDRSRMTLAPGSKPTSSRIRQSSSLSQPRVNGEISSTSSKRMVRNESAVTTMTNSNGHIPRNLKGEQLFREKQMRHVLDVDSNFQPLVETVNNPRSQNNMSSSSFHRREFAQNDSSHNNSTATNGGNFFTRSTTEPKQVADEQTRRRESLSLSASDLYAPFPDFLIASPHDENTIPNLILFLSERMRKQRDWIAAIMDKEDVLRRQMRDVVLENQSLKVVITQYRNEQHVRDKMIDDLESRLMTNRDSIMQLKRNNADHEQQKNSLVKHIEDSRDALLREKAKRKKFEEKLRSRARDFRERKERELDDQVKQVHSSWEARLRLREQQLARVKDIIVADGRGAYATGPPSVDGTIDSALASSKSSEALYTSPHDRTPGRGARSRSRSRGRDTGAEYGQPVINPRYRRSRSADRWIDHRPKYVVPTGTLTQPHIKDGKFVHQLQARDTKNATAYALTHQEADTDGELETRLYKGDIIPTASGGRAVVFKDVEVLKQYDPCDDEIRSPRYAATSASVAATNSGAAVGGYSSHQLITNAELQKRCREALTSGSGMTGGGGGAATSTGAVNSSNNFISSPLATTTASTGAMPAAANSGPMPLFVTKRSHKVGGVG